MVWGWLPILFFLIALPMLGWWLGRYVAKVFTDQRVVLTLVVRPIESAIYHICCIDETKEMDWKSYAISLIIFTIVGIFVLFFLQEVQGWLPLNPEVIGSVRWDTAVSTAISFATNTNWQSYVGETTMSYGTQMVGLTVQNFLSAAIGLASAIALIRGFQRVSFQTIGNFWVDITRSLLYILIPMAILLACIFTSQGIVQNFNPFVTIETLDGGTQLIPGGPVASQEAIKHLGTNGGGFFNANSAHPFENPTALTNILQVLGFLLIPISLPFTFGIMINNRRQGWAIFAAMMILFLAGLGVALWTEMQGNPGLAKMGVSEGANIEGKEVRFGIVSSVLFAHGTTAIACGAVDSAHDSMLPLTGLVLLFNMLTSEAIFGGVGVGLVTMFFYAILTMFIVSLMVGKSPQFLGKKLDPFDMTMSVIGIIAPGILLLIMSGIALASPDVVGYLGNSGAHGLSEILYAFASTAGNNGSAFGGLNADNVFFNLTTSLSMLIGRFATILPGLAIAGSLAAKKPGSSTSAISITTDPLFVLILVSMVIIIGALTFFPPLVLGPFLEHLMMVK